MFEWIRTQVLRATRVPPAPSPPFGAAGSVKIFRAGRNYYHLRLARWGAGQVGAMIGISFSLTFLYWFKAEVERAHQAPPQPSPAAIVTPPAMASTPKPAKPPRDHRNQNPRDALRTLAPLTPPWVIPLVELLELGGILLFVVQVPVTFAAVRLEYELHWYIVTDRSLRIRTGLFRLTESTMSFANLQQVEVKQGPLQRLLGLADVHVQSAGGGGDGLERHHAGDSLHTGIFHSVENAEEIRDLVLARLRQFREAGLGDPDEPRSVHPVPPSSPPDSPASATAATTIAAAREVLAEAQALRHAVSRGGV